MQSSQFYSLCRWRADLGPNYPPDCRPHSAGVCRTIRRERVGWTDYRGPPRPACPVALPSQHTTPAGAGCSAGSAGGCSLSGAAPLPTEIPVGIKQVGRKLASRIKGLRDRCAVSLVPVPAPQQLPTSVTMIVSQSDQ